jgi:Tol biopolymer transport system component
MTLRWWWLLAVIPLALVACGGGEKTRTPEPSATASVVQPSATARVNPPPSTTAEMSPSPTQFPTLPPTASPEPTEVAPATPEATPIPAGYLEGTFVVPTDGSGAPVRLADDGEVHEWSPDGTLIAITTLDPDQSGCNISTQACFWQLFLIRADGQGQPVSLGSGSAPQWSADGKRLLFYRLIRAPVTRPPNPPFTEVTAKEVCLVDAATGETAVLASWVPTAFFGAPTWSPDESRVLLNFGEPGAPSLYVVKADGSEPPVKLADGSGPTDWSPDSRRIVYSCGDYVCTVAADGSEAPRQLVPARDPDWSPDGSRIAVEAGALPSFEIWLIDPDTAQGIKLVDGLRPHEIASVWFQWSPDGSMILYQAAGSLYVLAAGGNAPPTKLAEGTSAMWSPDGKRVALWRSVGQSENSAGVHQLLAIDADGSGLTLLADGVAPWCITYAWSPDSRQLAFSTFECSLM